MGNSILKKGHLARSRVGSWESECWQNYSVFGQVSGSGSQLIQNLIQMRSCSEFALVIGPFNQRPLHLVVVWHPLGLLISSTSSVVFHVCSFVIKVFIFWARPSFVSLISPVPPGQAKQGSQQVQDRIGKQGAGQRLDWGRENTCLVFYLRTLLFKGPYLSSSHAFRWTHTNPSEKWWRNSCYRLENTVNPYPDKTQHIKGK